MPASAEGAGCADEESEVVEPAAIVGLVNANVWSERARDERERAYQPVPDAYPEACGLRAGNAEFRTGATDGKYIHGRRNEAEKNMERILTLGYFRFIARVSSLGARGELEQIGGLTLQLAAKG